MIIADNNNILFGKQIYAYLESKMGISQNVSQMTIN